MNFCHVQSAEIYSDVSKRIVLDYFEKEFG